MNLMLQSRCPHRAMKTIAPRVHFFVILRAGIHLPGASRARAVSTTTSWARHIEMKLMLPIRIVCRAPPGATGRQARQAGRPVTGRAALVLAANTVKFLRRQVTNSVLIAPVANTATKMRPAASDIASTVCRGDSRTVRIVSNAKRARSDRRRRNLFVAAPRFVRRVNMAHSILRKAPPFAVIAPSENTVEQLGHPPATLVRIVPRESTAQGLARNRWTSAARRVRQAHIRKAAHQVVPCVKLARPRSLANPSASRAFPGPSSSLESARCALSGLTQV